MPKLFWLLSLASGGTDGDSATLSPELEAPFVVEDAKGPIDVEIGHAAPFFVDFDGDGLSDLLVGQFGKGKLRVYRNTGSKAAPRFDGFTLFQAGGADGTVPSG